MLRPLLFRLAEERLVVSLLLLLPLLLWAVPSSPAALLEMVQWQTIAILAGLLLLSRGLEESGYLALAGRWLLLRLRSQRRLAMALVLFSALLSMVITNDVTLFIVVPLTLALRVVPDMPVGRLVIFEALAVNAGSALSPVGNPQNLYLWQYSGSGFLEFVWVMFPIALMLLGLILIAIPVAFRPVVLPVPLSITVSPPDKPLFWLSLLLYPPLLLCANAGMVQLLLPFLLGLYGWRYRDVVRALDWPLLLLFVLMFLDLGLLARLPVMGEAVWWLAALPGGMMGGGALVSQIISNVPAAILLTGLDGEWRAVAWGVSIGGFGLAIGSLANLIALRMARETGLWRDFHAWSIPLWLIGWGAGLLLSL